MSAAPIPSGFRPPVAFVDSQHHGAWILIANCVCLTTGLIAFLCRVYIRTKISPPLKCDDYTLAIGTLLGAIQAALVFAMVRYGYGTSQSLVSDSNRITQGKLRFAANIFDLSAIYASKICLVLFYRRISPSKRTEITSRIVLASCVVLGLASILLIALHQPLSAPWKVFASMHDKEALNRQWIAVVTFTVLTELMLFGESLLLAWNLKAPLIRKFYIVFPFSLRLPIIAISILRLYYVHKQLHSSDPTLAGTLPTVLMQLELFYSLTTATIPCLRPFLVGFTTNYGAIGGRTVIGGSHVAYSRHARGDTQHLDDSKATTSHMQEAHSAALGRGVVSVAESEPEQEWFTPGLGFHREPPAATAFLQTRGRREGWLAYHDASDAVIWNEIQWGPGRQGVDPEDVACEAEVGG